MEEDIKELKSRITILEDMLQHCWNDIYQLKQDSYDIRQEATKVYENDQLISGDYMNRYIQLSAKYDDLEKKFNILLELVKKNFPDHIKLYLELCDKKDNII